LLIHVEAVSGRPRCDYFSAEFKSNQARYSTDISTANKIAHAVWTEFVRRRLIPTHVGSHAHERKFSIHFFVAAIGNDHVL
jgi:hypothetical protein